MSRPGIQRRLRLNHNDIKQSNLQSPKQGKNRRRVAQKKRPHPGWLVFSWQPHTAAAKGSICLRSRHMAGNGCGLNDISLGHLLCQLGSRCIQHLLTHLGKPHSNSRGGHLGIALLAFAPPPRTQTGTLGHFFPG